MNLLRIWKSWRARKNGAVTQASVMTDVQLCAPSCTLAACFAGDRATVRQLQCTKADAMRLRTLGVYEGAMVGIVDRRNGVLLDVCGSRLALDATMAGAIVVDPTAA